MAPAPVANTSAPVTNTFTPVVNTSTPGIPGTNTSMPTTPGSHSVHFVGTATAAASDRTSQDNDVPLYLGQAFDPFDPSVFINDCPPPPPGPPTYSFQIPSGYHTLFIRLINLSWNKVMTACCIGGNHTSCYVFSFSIKPCLQIVLVDEFCVLTEILLGTKAGFNPGKIRRADRSV
ncbi:hypothetical protein Pelo_19516 [Pelomyxa schiedti]|nr:hypothetical protein Pelo_19516 [Pelomyxa schiedti]